MQNDGLPSHQGPLPTAARRTQREEVAPTQLGPAQPCSGPARIRPRPACTSHSRPGKRRAPRTTSPLSIKATPATLRFYGTNCHSIRNKTRELDLLLRSGEYDILGLTETWLSDRDSDCYLAGGGRYQAFRCDRGDGRQGGGAALLVRTDIPVTRVPLPQLPELSPIPELVCVDLLSSEPGQPPLRLLCWYRPPEANANIAESLCSIVRELCEVPGRDVAVFADLNTPNVTWGEDGEAPLTGAEAVVWECFDVELGLEQLVRSPTRRNPATGRWSLLDCLHVSDSSRVSDCEVQDQFASSDHLAVSATLHIQPPPHQPSPRLNWHKADWENLNRYLSLIPDDVWRRAARESQSTNDLSRVLYDTCNEAVRLFVPVHRPKAPGNKKTHLPTFLARLKAAKNRLARKCLNSEPARRAAKRYKRTDGVGADQGGKPAGGSARALPQQSQAQGTRPNAPHGSRTCYLGER